MAIAKIFNKRIGIGNCSKTTNKQDGFQNKNTKTFNLKIYSIKIMQWFKCYDKTGAHEKT